MMDVVLANGRVLAADILSEGLVVVDVEVTVKATWISGQADGRL